MAKKIDTNQLRVKRTKQSLIWTHIFMLIQLLEKYPEITSDNDFMNIYEKLYEYVSSKTPLQSKGDILDWYVVVEQESTDNNQ